MSEHSYTEVTSQGWLSRIGSALKGLIFGLLFFVISFPLLFWNEGRAVDRINALEEGAGSVVTVNSDEVLAANEKKLIHLVGFANTEEMLADNIFQINENALQLRRDVRIYQWEEDTETRKKKKLGGGEETITTYTYDKVWKDELIDSDNFAKTGYNNPDNIPFDDKEWSASRVDLGAFTLSSTLVNKIANYQPIETDPNTRIELPSGTASQPYQDGYYIGSDPSNPQVGDLQVTFSKVVPQTVSVVAMQTGSSFQKYMTENGGNILLLETGQATAEAMFQTAMTENTIMTWVIRGGGLLLMFFGLTMVLKPISVFADVVPLFGNIAGAGIAVVSFLSALVLSLITIAIAWIWFRPLIGGGLLVISLGLMWFIKNKIVAARLLNKAKQMAQGENSTVSSAPITPTNDS